MLHNYVDSCYDDMMTHVMMIWHANGYAM